jgi:hypothetical protein
MVKENKQEKARSIVKRLAPEVKVTENTVFTLPQKMRT